MVEQLDEQCCQMTANATLTDLAAGRLLTIRDDELPEAVQHQAVLCLMDYLGALCAGLSVSWASALLSYARAQPSLAVSDGGAAAHVLGLEKPVYAEVAAFTNAAIAHSVIRDDMHLGAGAHIGVMVISAALALAERERWTGSQLLKGIVGGYEMCVALGVAVRSSGPGVNQHFRPSGIVGAFGAAGVGIAGGTPNDTTSNPTRPVAASALSLAANMAAGLNEWAWAGGMEINTQMGTASRSGNTALDLARAGIQSSSTILEGKDGLFAAYGCDIAVASAKFRHWLDTSQLGGGILGARFKNVAGCNFIQTPLAVASTLGKEVGAAGRSQEQIEKITIVTTSAASDYPGCNYAGPFEKVQQTKMSLQYGVSAALLFEGCIDESAFCHYQDESLHALIQKCVIEGDTMYDNALSLHVKQPCRIIIQFEDGTRRQDALEDVPWLEAMAVEDRFKQEAGKVFDSHTVDETARVCWELLSGEEKPERLFALLATPFELSAMH